MHTSELVCPITPDHIMHEAIARVAKIFEFETDLDPKTGEIYLDTRLGTKEQTFVIKLRNTVANTKVEMRGNDEIVQDSFIASLDEDLAARSRPLAASPISGRRDRSRPRNPLGSSPSAPPAAIPAQAEAVPVQEKSKKNWPIRILGACALAWLFWTDDGQDFANNLLSKLDGFVAETDISKYDCDMVADEIKGLEMKNLLGGRFKIVTADAGKQMERTETSLTCSSTVLLDDGRSMDVAASVRKNGSYEVLIGVRPLDM